MLKGPMLLAIAASGLAIGYLGERLDRRRCRGLGLHQRQAVDGAGHVVRVPVHCGVAVSGARLKRLALAAAAGVALSAAPAHAADPYACFGGARYIAMGAGFQCADLPVFCAGARALLVEAAGNEAAAEKLARSRGHGRLSIALAHRFCK